MSKRSDMTAAARAMAVCGLCTALIVVLMSLGSAFYIMTFVCPILSGVLVLLVRENYGPRYALTLWGAASLLSLLLVPEKEMAAIFAGLLGWYPVGKPHLDRLPPLVRPLVKVFLWNGVIVAIYMALLYVIGVDALGLGVGWENLLLLAMGNLLMALYDRSMGRLCHTLIPRLSKLLPGN